MPHPSASVQSRATIQRGSCWRGCGTIRPRGESFTAGRKHTSHNLAGRLRPGMTVVRSQRDSRLRSAGKRPGERVLSVPVVVMGVVVMGTLSMGAAVVVGAVVAGASVLGIDARVWTGEFAELKMAFTGA